MSDITAIPCHWCEGSVDFRFNGKYYITCRDQLCAASGPFGQTKDAAITAWNAIARTWQPPETAPPNKSVLVSIPDADHYGPGVYRAIRVSDRAFGMPDRWHVTGLNMGRDCDPARITGWMPLPALRKEDQE